MYEQQTYFELFELPPQFAIDLAGLERAYFGLQRQYHPDRFAGKSPEEKAAAMQQSVRVNDAYHTLKSPLKRAEYMLKLAGLTVNKDGAGVKPDQALLMEAMEDREALEEAADTAAIHMLEEKNQSEIKHTINKMIDLFNAKDYKCAAQESARLQYLEKFAAEIRLKKLKGIAA